MKRLDFHWIVNTWTYTDKKQIPQSIENNAEFYFIEKPEEIKNKSNSYFVSIINDNFSEDDLFNEYYTKFQFPYFGFNWNALQDCLGGLEWIKQKDVFVYHPKLPQLNEIHLEIYLDILCCTVGLWKKWEEHNFEVYFNLQDYDVVQQVMLSSSAKRNA